MPIHFREFQQQCVFKTESICSYWEKATECHILACPFYSHKTEPRRRKALEKQLQDKVTFDSKDFDNIGNTVQDVIKQTKDENIISTMSGLPVSEKSSIMDKKISRMHCIACGEQIKDDKFITIRDPKGIVIYLHSKGKCTPRHDQIKIARDRWHKLRQHEKTISSSQETET
jgi:hypothetical protein